MSKIKKVVSSILVMVLLGIMLSTSYVCTANAAVSDKTVKSTYSKYLKSHSTKGKTGYVPYFAVVTVKGSSVPVLLTSEEVYTYRAKNQSNDWTYYLYKSGKVKKAGTGACGRGLSISNKYLVGTFYDGFDLTYMKNGKPINSVTYSHSQADPEYYKITGDTQKVISKSAYMKARDKYMTNGKAVKFYKNTKNNRSKYL